MAWCLLAFFSRKAFAVCVAIVFVLDAAACVGVFVLDKAYHEGDHDSSEYRAGALDTLLLFIFRVVVVPGMALFAFKSYHRIASESPFRSLAEEDDEATPAPPEPTVVAASDGNDLRAPLAAGNLPVIAPARRPRISSMCSTASAFSTFEAQKMHAELMKKAEKWKSLIMWGTFGIVTAMSMYNGLKAVIFDYNPSIQGWQAGLFGFIMFSINFEFFVVLDFLEEMTKEKGELIQHVHMHPLYFEIGLKCHQCDICNEPTKGPHYIAYRCRTCDFDLCPRCHRKKNDPSARGYGAQAIRRDGEQLTTWTYFTRIVQMTLEFGHTSTLAVICLIGTQGMQIWSPHVQGNIFDSIIQYTAHPLDGKGAFEHAILMYLFINVLQGTFGGLKSYAQELVLRQLAISVRQKLFKSVIRMDISFFDSMHTGQLTSRLTNDASQMVQPLNTLLNDLIANLMLLVGGGVMAFHTSWKLSMLALTVVPPISYCYRQYARWGRKINRSIYQAYGEANSVATEAMHNIRTVRGFSTEQHETEKYQDIMDTALGHGKRNALVGAGVNAFSTYLNLGTAVLILWYGGMQACEGQSMTIGSLITFQLYWNMMNSAFLSLGNVFNDLIRSSSAAERVISLIDAEPETDPDAGELMLKTQLKGRLQLRGVQFRYKTRPENVVLKGVDLDVEPGTVTALVGKSGGGKSTLVHLLMRFYEPTAGKILLDGEDMTKWSSKSVRACCGFVAQDTQLFAKSIEENLAYGLGREHTKEELEKACTAANAHEFILETEDGYDTRVGERGMLLSGGQRQRLAIARCFLRQPRLLFLDEATSALDAENEGVVQEALDYLIKEAGCTVVLIAHRLSTVINANQIAVVHKGQIIEKGPHDELLGQGGIYKKLVDRQMSRDASAVLEEKSGDKKNAKGKGKGKSMQNEIDELINEMVDSGELAEA